MIENIKIQNFRCFSELEIKDLKRFNIIVGENASGKSAFLESLYLQNVKKSADLLQIREWRQRGYLDKASRESPSAWEDLFHNFNSGSPIYIGIGHFPELRIEYKDTGKISLAWREAEPQRTPPSASADAESTRWSFTAPRLLHPCEFIGASSAFQYRNRLAEKLSELSKEGETTPIVDALRSEFPFLRDLSLELDGWSTSVFASIEGSKRKFPAALVSDGFNKLLNILLSIASVPKGTLLVDQIEDGFYYKKLASIWRVICRFAVEKDVQIFATTHSRECLEALQPVIENNENDFALLRASKMNGASKITVSDGRRFSSALSQEFEVR
jgi:hypothetical protein